MAVSLSAARHELVDAISDDPVRLDAVVLAIELWDAILVDLPPTGVVRQPPLLLPRFFAGSDPVFGVPKRVEVNFHPGSVEHFHVTVGFLPVPHVWRWIDRRRPRHIADGGCPDATPRLCESERKERGRIPTPADLRHDSSPSTSS